MAQSQLEAANAALNKLGARTVLTTVSTSGTTQEERAMANRIDICKRAVIRMQPWKFAMKRKKVLPYQNVAVSDVTYVSSELIEVTHSSLTLSAGHYVTLSGIEGANGANGSWEVTTQPTPGTVTRMTAIGITSSDLLGTYTASSTDYIRRSPAFEFSYLYDLPSDCLRVWKIDDELANPSWKVEGGQILSDNSSIEIRYLKDSTDYTLMDPLFYEAWATYTAWDCALELGRDMTVKDRLMEDFIKIIGKARFVDATENSQSSLDASDWTGSRLNATSDLQTGWLS